MPDKMPRILCRCHPQVRPQGRARRQIRIVAELCSSLPVWLSLRSAEGGFHMHGIIYLVGLVVIVLAILSLFGLR
ncbi:hypothetical protein ACSBOB_05625 [Mesorhizobium sp. ASY16-5R]|uniref:hypothetical protein n=1 Tax=Mesorhizobium sp. ASY16-5R TaxID=3445772 RepID=UPI003F9FC61F